MPDQNETRELLGYTVPAHVFDEAVNRAVDAMAAIRAEVYDPEERDRRIHAATYLAQVGVIQEWTITRTLPRYRREQLAVDQLLAELGLDA